ncbi:MAG: CxxC-x17-CxxC domain-containing protein [Patescibacteria group bacterium]
MRIGKYNTKRNSRSRDDSYGGSSSHKGGFGGKKESFRTRCAECGNGCTVPFKPNGRKPVLCSMCFQNSEGSSDRKRFGDRPTSKRPFGKPSFEKRSDGPNLKKEMTEINRKLDEILSILNEAL